jgi:opacity protein-like surface antigen
MTKRKVAIIMASFFCLGASLANAQYYWYFPAGAGPYIRAGVGPSIFQDGKLQQFSTQGFSGPANQPVSYDTGVAFDAALGYAFDKYFGVDFESGYVWARIHNIPGYDANGSSIGNVPLLVNGTLSLPIPHTNIVPYMGAGAGGSVSVFDARAFSDQAQTETAYGTESDTVFAYQAFAGVRFMLGPNASLGVGYKFFATDAPVFSYPPSPNLNIGFRGVYTHSILFTLQFNF